MLDHYLPRPLDAAGYQRLVADFAAAWARW
jgi:hypothetical protein